MTKWTLEDLQDRLRQTQAEREQAQATLARVHDLLAKADERCVSDDTRRWNKVVDDLERALAMVKSRLTACDQHAIELNRKIAELEASGNFEGYPEEVRREFEQLGLCVPKDHITAAEQIMTMPLDVLRDLTLDQVAEMHTMLFEAPEQEATPENAKPAFPAAAVPKAKHSHLDDRIERARLLKQQRDAGTKRHGSDFVERRNQKLLRDAIAKASRAQFAALSLEEVDAFQACRKQLAGRTGLGESDARLRDMLDRFAEGVEVRGRELRRKRAQGLLHRNP